MQDMKAQKLRKEDRMEIKWVKSKDAWNGEKRQEGHWNFSKRHFNYFKMWIYLKTNNFRDFLVR